MMTLFVLGPIELSVGSIVLITILILIGIVVRKIVNSKVKRYLKTMGLGMEGRREIILRLVSQLIYLILAYFIFLVIQLKNPDVSFSHIFNYAIIDSKNFHLSFFHIMMVVLVFFLAKLAVRFVQLVLSQRLRNRKDYDSGLEYVYVQFSKYVIYFIAIMIASKILFDDISGILTGSLGILVGVGLGLQDVFKDFVAGIVLLGERNLMVGDIIELPDTDGKNLLVAKVVKIGVRTSKIETREGNVLILPNTQLSQNRVENWSHGSTLSRFTIEVPVSFGCDTELVIRLLKKAVMGHPSVNKSQEIVVRLVEFNTQGHVFNVLFWADQSWNINNYKSEIRLEIDRLFKEYKIRMPYQQMDVHFVSDKRTSERNTGHYDE